MPPPMSQQFFDEGRPATGRKVLLATTCYSAPCAAYAFAIASSREALHAEGIETAYLLLQGNCHVDDARNSVVRDFLASDCDELIFIDADVTWEPRHLVALCARNLDVVGGIYPYRREGSVTMPVRLKDGAREFDGLMEVDGLPTGFLKIKRNVLERIALDAPKYWDKIYLTALVFDRPDPDADGTRWGGDIAFCRKWQALGGRLYADTRLRLGHTAEIVVTDSLAAHLRRATGTTLDYVIPRICDGSEEADDFNELAAFAETPWAADAGVLALLAGVARKCRGPIIETGSGLSSLVLGASAPTERVYSLEHEERFSLLTREWLRTSARNAGGVRNVTVCFAPLAADFWYDLSRFELPAKFALGFCDGPPRLYGTRFRFFEEIAARCEAVIVDDIKTDNNFARKVHAWALAHGRTMEVLGRAALILKAQPLKAAA